MYMYICVCMVQLQRLCHYYYCGGCLQRSWVGASKKQCEELLEFIRHLAEDDKEGVMAVKVCSDLYMLCVCVHEKEGKAE